jgi:HSP20 family protein
MEKNVSIDVKKWNPWNWFRKEDEHEGGRSITVRRNGQNGNGLPSLYSGSPLWDLHREMDRLFDNVFQRFNTYLPDISNSVMLKPSVDIRESKKNYKITVEVPGVEESDVKLEFSDGTLTISGEKKHEKEEKDDNYHCVERSYGSFRRVLSLPEDINPDAIEAKFKNGVLTITVPRKQMAKPKDETRMIEIKHAA